MNANNSLTAVKGYLGASIQVADHDLKERQSYPAITITRQTGARAISIGNQLIEQLQRDRQKGSPLWTLFEKDLIKRVLSDNKLPVSHEKYFPEDSRNYIDDIIEELAGLHPPAVTINKECNELIKKLTSRGHVIIVGRCGNFITQEMKNVINIRLIGSLSCRIKHLMNSKGITQKVAESYLKKEDHLRKRFAKENFAVSDIDNPQHYDLVLKTDHLDNHTVVNLLCNLIWDKFPKWR